MAKKKTPEHLAKARKELLPFHQEPPEKLMREVYSNPERLPAGTPLPPPTAHGWPRVDPLLAGLEGVIPPERFAAINDRLRWIDALTIMVQNLRETSRADVLSRAASGAGGSKGGRGHKKDGSGNQATHAEIDAEIDSVIRTSGAPINSRLARNGRSDQSIIIDVRIALDKKHRQAGYETIRGRLLEWKKTNNR